MRHFLQSATGLALFASAAAVAAAAAQKPAVRQQGSAHRVTRVTWRALRGDWEGVTMRGTSDSVIAPVTTQFTADRKVWLVFPNRPPVRAHVIAMAADSIVVLTDEYDSITRPGHRMSVHMIVHVAKDRMIGTFHATFDDNTSFDGTSSATRKAK